MQPDVYNVKAAVTGLLAKIQACQWGDAQGIAEDMLTALANQPNVAMAPGTPLFCYNCGDIEAPLYLFKRMAGKWVPLCFKNGDGCWERACPPLCDFKDYQGIQCSLDAEWLICYGKDMLMRTKRCSCHAFEALADVSEHRVFRLDPVTGRIAEGTPLS